MQLTILRGHTTKKSYRFTKSRINLGRLAEVLDDHYRVVRRNDLAFQEGADNTDQTVSREHAHIGFDEKTGELRLYDDGSAYGTTDFSRWSDHRNSSEQPPWCETSPRR